MFSYRSRSARALLGGVSGIALSVAGVVPFVVAQEAVNLDPITVVSTKPTRPARPAPRPAAPERSESPPAVSQPAPVTAPPPPPVITASQLLTTDNMPATEVLGAVSTIRQNQIKQIMPTRPSDLLYSVPGVTVQERQDDPGTAVNIRGLQDFGRVNVVIDGARQNFQRSGHNANGMFYLEPELISTIDIIRGPVANVFGSGAIGGITSFRTKDWEDVLKPGERWGVLTNTMGSTNLGGVGSLFAAARVAPNAEIFAGGTYRKQSAYRDGDGNVIPNTGNEIWTGTVKGTYRPADGHQIKLGYITYDADYKTGQPYPAGTPPPTASIYGTNTRNEIATARWTYSRPDDRLFDFDTNVYWTRTATDQTKIDGTPSVISGQLGDRRNFTINTRGFDANNTTRFDTGPFHHALNYGGDSFRDEVDTTGFGTIFTPSGERTVSGAFIQLKTDYAGIFESITAVRYDSYALQGGGYYNDGHHMSPKSTIGFTAIQGFTPYVTYAEGYRAPAITETLVTGIHPANPQFTLLPNPGLQPEIGKNKEIGVNLRYNDVLRAGDQFRAKFNVYRNDVTNYIELKYLGPFQRGQGDQICLNLVAFFCEQYQNIPSARLEGMEFESFYDTGQWFAGLAGTHHVRGRDLTNDQPLATIPPDQITTTLGARFLDRKLTLAMRWQAVMAKNPLDIPPGAEAAAGATSGPPYAYYPTSAFNLVSLYAGYQIDPDRLASLSVENLLNSQYARYLNVTPSPDHGINSTPLPFYSQGITIKGSLTVRFSDQTLKKG
jgi:hemoglobin/transferrin/lactoferrin receptor protein